MLTTLYHFLLFLRQTKYWLSFFVSKHPLEILISSVRVKSINDKHQLNSETANLWFPTLGKRKLPIRKRSFVCVRERIFGNLHRLRKSSKIPQIQTVKWIREFQMYTQVLFLHAMLLHKKKMHVNFSNSLRFPNSRRTYENGNNIFNLSVIYLEFKEYTLNNIHFITVF